MATEIQIEGTAFLINGKPTYEGVTHQGRRTEGLLFNSRMVQAIFDDENPRTAHHWCYPDTGTWDADRNTNEFCAMLPEYRRFGLLAVTVGLQGGGSIYTPEVYPHYLNSAFTVEGDLKPAYFDRLARILKAADETGMAVIVNYFYWRQLEKLRGEQAIVRAAEAATDWLLRSGHRNILIDVYNEFTAGDRIVQSERIHELIDIVQQTTVQGRRLLASASIMPGHAQAPGRWQELQDYYLPHGNSFWAGELRAQLRQIRASDAYLARPRPLLINEDSMYLNNLEAAVDEYASWGFYAQGFGCGGWNHGRYEWPQHAREKDFEHLSGFQTVPVNWSINTGLKRSFFYRLGELTGSDGDEVRE